MIDDKTVWDEKRIALLRKHCADGISASVSAGLINKETGGTFTRSAIIGKRHRLGIGGRTKSRAVAKPSLAGGRGAGITMPKTAGAGSVLKPTAQQRGSRTWDDWWSPERDALVLKAHADGLDFAQIAALVNKKTHSSFTAGAVKNHYFKIKPERVSLPKHKDEPKGHEVVLLDLREHHCRWPSNTVGLFCGAPKQDGSVYCPHHHERAYQPNRNRPAQESV